MLLRSSSISVLIIFAFALFAANLRGEVVRVDLRILDRQAEARIAASHGLSMFRTTGIVRTNNVRIDAILAPSMIRPVDPMDTLLLSTPMFKKRYRGAFICEIGPNGTPKIFSLVSEDEYLESVVGAEMDSSFPKEALRAQAVVSRTLLYHMRNKRTVLADIDGVHQVYRGCESEHRAAADAVRNTRGRYLRCGNAIPYPYFHSTSAGYVLPPSIDRGIPTGDTCYPSSVVTDAVDGVSLSSRSPYFRWFCILPYASIERAVRIEGVRSFEAVMDGSVIRTVIVRGATNSIMMPGYRFRAYLERSGFSGMRSVFARVRCLPYFAVIDGRGFGHLSGMPQWSARELAIRGWAHAAILGRYYPGATIETMDVDISKPRDRCQSDGQRSPIFRQ